MALYQKYRPQTFAEVIGEEHITVPLINALNSGKINHAYLFSGPRGTGKTSSARIMARSINCTGHPKPSATPCGKCQSCLALAPGGGGSVDVIELDAASNGGVDDTRELRDRAFYSPAISRYRVFIIDEAHMVSNAGFNALLKIVEEPPEHLIFIFATTEPEKVLPTIRSRTHHYPFRLLSPADMEKLLKKVLSKEKVEIDTAALPSIIRAGGGSPRDTLSVLDQMMNSNPNEKITFETVRKQLGLTDISLLDDAIAALSAGDGKSLFNALEKAFNTGLDPRRFSSDLIDKIRDLILLKTVPSAFDDGLLALAGGDEQTTINQSKNNPLETLIFWADELQDALLKMRGKTSTRLILEITVAKMLLPSRNKNIANTKTTNSANDKTKEVTQKLTKTEPVKKNQYENQNLTTNDTNSTKTNIENISEQVSTNTKDLNDNTEAINNNNEDISNFRNAWPGIKKMIYAKDKVIGVMLSGADILRKEKDNIYLTHESKPLIKRLNEKRGIDLLTNAFLETFSRKYLIQFVSTDNNIVDNNQPAKKRVLETPQTEQSLVKEDLDNSNNKEQNLNTNKDDKTTEIISTPSESSTQKNTKEEPLPLTKTLSQEDRIELLRKELGAKIIDSN